MRIPKTYTAEQTLFGKIISHIHTEVFRSMASQSGELFTVQWAPRYEKFLSSRWFPHLGHGYDAEEALMLASEILEENDPSL